MNTVVVSGIAILISMVVFFLLAMRQTGPVLSAIICTVIVGLTANGGLLEAVFTTFANGVGGFVATVFLCFVASFIMSGLMADSGLGASLGDWMVKKLGVRAAPYIILILSAILGYMGILAWMFIVAPIAISVLRAAKLPRDVCCICTACGGGVLMCLCPGAVTAVNAMPTAVLGTTLYAAPVLSIIMIVVFVALSILYLEWYLRKCKREGKVFTEMDGNAHNTPAANANAPRPHIIKAVIVLVFTIVLVAVLQIRLNIFSFTAVAITLTASSVLVVILCWNNLKGRNWLTYLRDSVANSYSPVLMMSCVVAYAGVVATTPFFQWISDALTNAQMNPYVLTVIVAVIFAALSADCAGGTSSFCNTFAAKALALGGNPEIIHRLAIAGGTISDSMPHNSALILQMSIVGVSHKEAYKHFVVVQILFTGISTLVGLGIACLFY